MKKEGMPELAKKVFDELDKEFVCTYDQAGSIGRRYRRMDEVGTTLCVTIDHDSLKNKTITLREISSMKQIRVNIEELRELIGELLYEGKDFKKLQ